MTTYNDLINDVGAWLSDTSHAAKVPSFIRLAETQHNKLLRIIKMSTDVELTTVAQNPAQDFAYIDRPADLLAPRLIRRKISHTDPMDPSPLTSLEFGRVDEPTKYAVDGERIYFNTWAGGHTVIMHYYRPFPPLTENNQSNWLSQNHYDAYLFGALSQAGDFVYDDEKLASWQTKFDSAMELIRITDQRDRYGPRKRVQPSSDTEVTGHQRSWGP